MARAVNKAVQRIAQRHFVAQRQFDVDALNAIGVFGHARQGNDHVFVDFEGIGVAADGSGAFAVQPKLFTRIGTDGHKTLASCVALAKRTTSEVACATSSASSPAMSPNNTILGKPPRLDLVV
jgi:hypothetical protein